MTPEGSTHSGICGIFRLNNTHQQDDLTKNFSRVTRTGPLVSGAISRQKRCHVRMNRLCSGTVRSEAHRLDSKID